MNFLLFYLWSIFIGLADATHGCINEPHWPKVACQGGGKNCWYCKYGNQMRESNSASEYNAITDTYCEFPKPITGYDDALNNIDSIENNPCDANGCPKDNICTTWE